jgi:hypothetical protein
VKNSAKKSDTRKRHVFQISGKKFGGPPKTKIRQVLPGVNKKNSASISSAGWENSASIFRCRQGKIGKYFPTPARKFCKYFSPKKLAEFLGWMTG